MTSRFKFSHNGTDYEALGNYGLGEKFIVTKFPMSSSRMLGTSGSPSGVKILALVPSIETQDELCTELNNKFPGLTDFASF